jgi:hypothetical protein
MSNKLFKNIISIWNSDPKKGHNDIGSYIKENIQKMSEEEFQSFSKFIFEQWNPRLVSLENIENFIKIICSLRRDKSK